MTIVNSLPSEQPRPARSDLSAHLLPRGIVSVVQTPFTKVGEIDKASLERLIEDAIAAGVHGLLTPVVASEVAYLTDKEREQVVRALVAVARGRVPFIIGASAADPAVCRAMVSLGQTVGAIGCLIAVPESVYANNDLLLPFFRDATDGLSLPLIVQDFQWGGPGLQIAQIRQLRAVLPCIAGVKIETLPAGPKYTAAREAFGVGFYVAGGWAVMQMIEALDRGVDAMIPESSMIRVYAAIHRLFVAGERERASEIFKELLPVLAFTNQDLPTSIAFFKRLLVRKGVFAGATLRMPGFSWDAYNTRIADELIEHYLGLEHRVGEGLL